MARVCSGSYLLDSWLLHINCISQILSYVCKPYFSVYVNCISQIFCWQGIWSGSYLLDGGVLLYGHWRELEWHLLNFYSSKIGRRSIILPSFIERMLVQFYDNIYLPKHNIQLALRVSQCLDDNKLEKRSKYLISISSVFFFLVLRGLLKDKDKKKV